MAASVTLTNRSAVLSSLNVARATSEPAIVRWVLIAVATLFLALFLFVPLAVVFASALAKGF
ncbi:MAG TPA: hypothetical protein VGF08_00935, partial [Terriglobales bacterium]